MKKILHILFLTFAAVFVFSACKRGNIAPNKKESPALTLKQTLENVDTAAYMIMAASMADGNLSNLPLGFRIGVTHRDFIAHAKAIAERGAGRFEDGKLTYFTDHQHFPSDIVVSNVSMLGIGTAIPDTLPVSNVEYVYNLQRPDSIEVMRLIDTLMSGARNGGFKASPVIAMPECFAQVWTRDNLIIRVFFVHSNATLHFSITDGNTLSENDVSGMVASIKANAARCYISVEDVKKNVQNYCKRHYKDYCGEGRWKADWYTSGIAVRHRYSFTDKKHRRRIRESVFRFDYALNLEQEFTITDYEIKP